MKGATRLAAMILLLAAAVSTAQATESYDDHYLSIVLSHWGQREVAWYEGDASGDGCVDEEDLSLVLSDWYSGVPECDWGDADGDGDSDEDDLSVLLSHWGQCGVTCREGDFSGDGCVDDDDLSPIIIPPFPEPWPPALLARPPVAGDLIPEPISMATLLLGGLALTHRRRRQS